MIEPSSNNQNKDQTEYKSSPLKENTGSTRNLRPKNDGDKSNKVEEKSYKDEKNSEGSQSPDARNDGDNKGNENGNSDENTSENYKDNRENGNPEVESYRDNKNEQPTNAVEGLEQIYLKHKTSGKGVKGRGKSHTRNNHPSTPKTKKERYGLTKHELKSLINDDQAIEMKQRYGNNRVVLDFSKGNDDAKIIVYDKHSSIEKRNKIRQIHESPAHSLASKGTENQFIGRLQKERAEYRVRNGLDERDKTRSKSKSGKKTRSEKKTNKMNKKTRSKKTVKKIETAQSSKKKSILSDKKSINKLKANVNLTKEAVQDVTSSKRGMMMTQYDKQECGLLSKKYMYSRKSI